MTDLLTVRVYGLPQAQPRAGRRTFAVAPGVFKTRSFDPPKAVDWKRTVMLQVLPVKPRVPLDDPLGMELIFHLPRPVSLPKKVVHHTKKPDLDNLTKGVKDALRQVVYRDDSLIAEFSGRKVYSEAPGVEIRIWRLP